MPGVAKKAVAKRKPLSFSVDCSKPVEDRIMKVGEFADFLSNNIKVAGKKGNLGDHVKVTKDKTKVTVTSDTQMSKRYLKYLTKKFLKKHQVRDWLRVIASDNDQNCYTLKYFNIAENEDADEDED